MIESVEDLSSIGKSAITGGYPTTRASRPPLQYFARGREQAARFRACRVCVRCRRPKVGEGAISRQPRRYTAVSPQISIRLLYTAAGFLLFCSVLITRSGPDTPHALVTYGYIQLYTKVFRFFTTGPGHTVAAPALPLRYFSRW